MQRLEVSHDGGGVLHVVFFFAKDGILSLIPLWITSAIYAHHLFGVSGGSARPRLHPHLDHGSEHSFERKKFVLWLPSLPHRAACFLVPSLFRWNSDRFRQP